MGVKYRHLTNYDRQVIEKLLIQGESKAFIAKHLRVSLSTIYREIKRNCSKNDRTGEPCYVGWIAQRKYKNKRKRRISSKLNSDRELRKYVYKKLRASWSPWQIEWHIKHHVPDIQNITHETIYRHIYSNWKNRNEFAAHLRRKHSVRAKLGNRKKRHMNRFHISLRPDIANNREEFGHWECDLMVFKRPSKYNLITLTERKSRFSIAIKNNDRKSRPTSFAIIQALKKLKHCVKSITFDQGSEFSEFEYIRGCLGADIYFCTPGSPHEKGAIENRNGVIRTIYPRDCDIMSVTQQEINHNLKSINERPMLCLNYLSPNMVFTQYVNGKIA